MALNPTTIRDNIISGIETAYGFTFTPDQKIEARKLWGVVSSAIVTEFITNGRITMVSNEFKVDVGTFAANITTGAITGQGQNAAFTAKGKIE